MIEQLTKTLKNMAKGQKLAKNDPNNPQPKMAVPSDLGASGKVTQKPAWLSQMQNNANAPQPTVPQPKAPRPKKYKFKDGLDARTKLLHSSNPDEMMAALKHPEMEDAGWALSKNPNTTSEHLEEAVKNPNNHLPLSILDIMKHPKFTSNAFHGIVEHQMNKQGYLDHQMKDYLLSGRVNPETFDHVIDHPKRSDVSTLQAVAGSPHIGTQQMDKLINRVAKEHGDWGQASVQKAAASNPRTPPHWLSAWATQAGASPELRAQIASNPATPEDLRNHLMTQDPHPDVRRAAELGFHRVFDNRAQ